MRLREVVNGEIQLLRQQVEQLTLLLRGVEMMCFGGCDGYNCGNDQTVCRTVRQYLSPIEEVEAQGGEGGKK